MNFNKILVYTLGLVTVIAVVVACKHHPDITDVIADNGGNVVVDPPDTLVIINPYPCDPDTVYFQNDILLLLNNMCATEDCHDDVDPEEDVELWDYAHIMEQVEAGDLNDSDLWDALNETGDDQMPPSDSPQLTEEQIDRIRTWILQGALNNFCQEDCDTSQFTFSSVIAPMMSNYCSSCHSGASPSGDLSLETYTQISAVALDGRLMNSLLGTDGAVLMPDNTTGLPECYIAQVQNWVNAGAPNN